MLTYALITRTLREHMTRQTTGVLVQNQRKSLVQHESNNSAHQTVRAPNLCFYHFNCIMQKDGQRTADMDGNLILSRSLPAYDRLP